MKSSPPATSLLIRNCEKSAVTLPFFCGSPKKLRFLPHLLYKTLPYLSQVQTPFSCSALQVHSPGFGLKDTVVTWGLFLGLLQLELSVLPRSESGSLPVAPRAGNGGTAGYSTGDVLVECFLFLPFGRPQSIRTVFSQPKK